ncbi:unnamed protein product [Fusarium graminearum]|uniref:Uncharacterized protein n=1 Tax=Gibberella zeae TaxID=5518 RepID=A0A2H3GUH2_GIBZA|nr:hypothetical protein FGRA07_08653 [Fusarium graminearum]CAF3605502.1 unnamed protein product [Fusarium graminearum]CAG1978110.1 unnamed protein product [Fusarium graminearum]CAG2000990.1 unnamed protein product [Fusarium graminearum]CAG2008752.1 unnamed protein product [Fusarium graminearum]
MSKVNEDTVRQFANSQARSIEAKDPKLVSTTLADNCRRHIAPASFMKSMGLPDELAKQGSSNETYEQQFATQMPFVESTSCNVHDISLDQHNLKATVHLTHQINLLGTEKDFFIENMILLDFDKQGERIEKIVEFTDVVESVKYMQALQGLAAAKSG